MGTSGLQLKVWALFLFFKLWADAGSHVEEQHPGVLHHRLDLAQEGDRFSPVDQTVVVRQGDVHHGTDLHLRRRELLRTPPVSTPLSTHLGTNLSTDGHGPLEDAVHAQDGRLRRVDYRCAEHGSKHATVADGEGSSIHVLNSQLVLTGLQHRHPCHRQQRLTSSWSDLWCAGNTGQGHIRIHTSPFLPAD